MPLSFALLPQRKPLRLSPLYLLTWLSISLSGVIFVSGILDLGLWMALSASLVTLLYHAAVLFLSARTPDLAPGTLITNFSTAGCAAILVFAWIAGFAMTLLALLVGRENFPGPPPLIQMTFPVHFMLVVLSGIELAVMGFVARLSGHTLQLLFRDSTGGHGSTDRTGRSMFGRSFMMRPLGQSARRVLSV
ncbi:hypothetical protein HMN09_00259100 [Mycena chlorophos]|uniref:Uncharacterized protein n=1 Tax=Mycena chlorophos TaxID=658473 RepID=A0A8H6WLK5_MYCCL|nr:hypothetical protein HMN09_00259100 [Mycena chlorophos]